MELLLKLLFWASLGIMFYAYFGYPVLLASMVGLKKMFIRNTLKNTGTAYLPGISIIITAYNEEAVIEEKIRNTLELNYPESLVEIIVVADGSADETVSLAMTFPGVRVLHQETRQGKLAAMNRGVVLASKPILVFSDANAFLNKECLINISRHYADPAVGGVAGEKRIWHDDEAALVGSGEGLYWRYESALKKLDSDLYTTVGAAGELFSIRRDGYIELPVNTIIEDFVQSMLICARGQVVRYEPNAYSCEKASISVKDEMERKIRISAGAFQAMGILKSIFNPFPNPILWFQFISHRIMRWTLCPLALVFLFLSSVILYLVGHDLFYGLAAVFQLIVYLLAIIGGLYSKQNIIIKPLFLPFYFVFMHVCVFIGFRRFLANTQSAIWDKAERRPQKS